MTAALVEAGKIGAFVRRDLLIAWSYRLAFFTDVVSMAAQAFVFSIIGQLVDPARLPEYGGSQTTYMEFVAIGLVLTLVITLLLERVATALRQEQVIGTLESLLTTPTRTATVQIGSAAFEFLWVPVRAALFLLAIAVGFGLDFHAGGILPAAVLVLAFVPFVWGLGLVSAATILTFRRGASGATAIATLLGLASGAFFPVELLPGWLSWITAGNPIAITLDGVREALLGGTGWTDVGPAVVLLVPLSAVALAIGVAAFRVALRRERRLGTLGLY
ncbi:MAG TPA: ABC transporter permease [Solirubrobacteraceae bacterium]|nr:ABC transporter permease [Solirubrobacteraceae bacterium]